MAVLHEQLVRQVGLPPGSVLANGFAWKVPGGSGYTNVADLTVLAPGWQRVGDVHVEPPPPLVVEVASHSTRAVDHGRKLADYRLGGARSYLLVDLPGTGLPDVVIEGRHLRLTLPPGGGGSPVT